MLEALAPPLRPEWIVPSRRRRRTRTATASTSSSKPRRGKLYVQVKSSRGGKAHFEERRRSARIVVVVAKVTDSPEGLLRKVVGELVKSGRVPEGAGGSVAGRARTPYLRGTSAARMARRDGKGRRPGPRGCERHISPSRTRMSCAGAPQPVAGRAATARYVRCRARPHDETPWLCPRVGGLRAGPDARVQREDRRRRGRAEATPATTTSRPSSPAPARATSSPPRPRSPASRVASTRCALPRSPCPASASRRPPSRPAWRRSSPEDAASSPSRTVPGGFNGGSLATSASCITGAQCQSRNCSAQSTNGTLSCGTCEAPIAVGQSCAGAGVCGPGAVCDYSSSSPTCTTITTVSAGGSCSGAATQCDAGLVCDASRTCVAASAAGAPCPPGPGVRVAPRLPPGAGRHVDLPEPRRARESVHQRDGVRRRPRLRLLEPEIRRPDLRRRRSALQ